MYDKPKNKTKTTGGPSSIKIAGCFICYGPHRAWDCPKCEKLAVLIIEVGSDSEVPTRLNQLQLLEAI